MNFDSHDCQHLRLKAIPFPSPMKSAQSLEAPSLGVYVEKLSDAGRICTACRKNILLTLKQKDVLNRIKELNTFKRWKILDTLQLKTCLSKHTLKNLETE